MTASKAFATFLNLAFCITIWFAIPVLMTTAAAIAWTLVVFNAFFSLGIFIGILLAYKQPETK